MDAKLYAVAGSHPCAAVEEALKLKAVPYRRIDLMPGYHALAQRLRFGARTVPGLVLGTRKLSGSRAIMRALELATPVPPLYPADPERRAAVEEAERWGEEVLQSGVRRLAWSITPNAGRAAATLQEDARAAIRLPAGLAPVLLPVLAPLEHRLNGVSRESTRADLAALPGWLDRVDALIAAGTLGGEDFRNAADLQIGASIRLLLAYGDLAVYAGDRPLVDHARRAIPRFPGEIPGGLLRN